MCDKPVPCSDYNYAKTLEEWGKGCKGYLLPCEKPITLYTDNSLKAIGQEKYWKCSVCEREVK